MRAVMAAFYLLRLFDAAFLLPKAKHLAVTAPVTANLNDPRFILLQAWLSDALREVKCTLSPASSDASFRRYFRVYADERSYIAMDAPPPHENVRPFLQVAQLMASAGVRVPTIHARDVQRGFLLLDDFGPVLYLERLHDQNADTLYGDALDMLLRLQIGVNPTTCGLPDYHAGELRRELELFRDWFLQKLLGLALSPDEQVLIDACWAKLITSALEQPTVVVHRDYHSRNLMVTETSHPGVLDFQDALVGPLTYDAVSLLRDCYIAWPKARVETWALDYAARLRNLGLLDRTVNDALFLRWFDLMGIQRHLKAIGIFSRLKLRDGKVCYLKDIPRTLDYVLQATRHHAGFAPFLALLERRVLPHLADWAD